MRHREWHQQRCVLLAGTQVKAGQALVVMSAMKMETSVAAPCDGVVRHVAVDLKDSVEAGQPFCQCLLLDSKTAMTRQSVS